MSLIGWIKKRNADLGQLDILVEDVCCKQAMQINSRGLKVQLAFLCQAYPNEIVLRKLIWHEIKTLRQYNMTQQSKVVPENNIQLSTKNKKKKRRTKG